MEDDDKRHFRVGGALDCLLTDNEQFPHLYKVVNTARPFGLMGKFVMKLPFNLTEDSELELFQEAYEESGYRMKIESVVKKFWNNKDAVEYYESLCCEEDDRLVLSKDEYDTVINMKKLIKANPHSEQYFYNDDPDIELRHQMPIYFEYMGEDCKGLLDVLVINHREKWILPVDLKSTSKPVEEFPIWYLKYGYYRQAAFYNEAVKQWVIKRDETVRQQNITESLVVGKDAVVSPMYSDYELRKFTFIVVEAKLSSTTPAVIFESTEADLAAGLLGGSTKYGRTYKGINDLMEAYLWHEKNNLWDMSKELYESKGKKTIDVFV